MAVDSAAATARTSGGGCRAARHQRRFLEGGGEGENDGVGLRGGGEEEGSMGNDSASGETVAFAIATGTGTGTGEDGSLRVWASEREMKIN